MIRSATSNDLPGISSLLETTGLPTKGVSEHLETFAVAEWAGSIVGVGGLEIYDSVALLRSVAVAPEHRDRGLATAICEHLEAAAVGRGIEYLYLLTETAAPFFSRRGFVAVSRDDAPPAIASSEEFSQLCPQSAVFMRRSA